MITIFDHNKRYRMKMVTVSVCTRTCIHQRQVKLNARFKISHYSPESSANHDKSRLLRRLFKCFRRHFDKFVSILSLVNKFSKSFAADCLSRRHFQMSFSAVTIFKLVFSIVTSSTDSDE